MVTAIVLITASRDKINETAERLVELTGIERTTTLIAFKAYSRHDLERLFSIGLEERERTPVRKARG